jgi:hypothetical protein
MRRLSCASPRQSARSDKIGHHAAISDPRDVERVFERVPGVGHLGRTCPDRSCRAGDRRATTNLATDVDAHGYVDTYGYVDADRNGYAATDGYAHPDRNRAPQLDGSSQACLN